MRQPCLADGVHDEFETFDSLLFTAGPFRTTSVSAGPWFTTVVIISALTYAA